MARCSYRYDSGDQCVYANGRLNEGEQCPAHKIVSREDRKREEARVKPKAEPKPWVPAQVKAPPAPKAEPSTPLAIGRPGDPSAPYCTCENRTSDHEPCTACGKPHFMDWREKKMRA